MLLEGGIEAVEGVLIWEEEGDFVEENLEGEDDQEERIVGLPPCGEGRRPTRGCE